MLRMEHNNTAAAPKGEAEPSSPACRTKESAMDQFCELRSSSRSMRNLKQTEEMHGRAKAARKRLKQKARSMRALFSRSKSVKNTSSQQDENDVDQSGASPELPPNPRPQQIMQAHQEEEELPVKQASQTETPQKESQQETAPEKG